MTHDAPIHTLFWNWWNTADLLRQRYLSGRAARVYGSPNGMAEVQTINEILRGR